MPAILIFKTFDSDCRELNHAVRKGQEGFFLSTGHRIEEGQGEGRKILSVEYRYGYIFSLLS